MKTATDKPAAPFSKNHGAHAKKGHSGLIKTSAKGGKGGNFMVSGANVKALGSKGKG